MMLEAIEKFNIKENRLVIPENTETRVSVHNLIKNISILTPITFPLQDLINKVPEYEENFNTLMEKMNDNNKLEYLFDGSILNHLSEMDTNLGDYLLTVSNLIEQYQPFKALNVDIIASPMYSDIICYKLTNELATKLIQKFNLDLQTNNLDAFNCLTETLIKMCKLRYYTAERYKKQFNLDLEITDPDFIGNYEEYLENVVTSTIPRLLVQEYVIIEPVGLDNVVAAIKHKVPELSDLLDVADLTPEMLLQIVDKIQHKTYDIYSQLPKEQAEDFRNRVTDLFMTDINEFKTKNSIQLNQNQGNPNQVQNSLFNSLQLPEVIFHSLIFASRELYLDNTLEDCRDNDIFSYIETILLEVTSDIQDENTDLFMLNDMFIYKYLSVFHLIFNADFSVISNMMNQQLQMAYQNVLNILNGISPEEAKKAAQERMIQMQEQAKKNGGQ